MAKISGFKIVDYIKMADDFLATHNLKRDDVTTGRDAWTVAHRAGIMKDAYQDRAIVDAHIQTALMSVFPRAKFNDARRY